MRRMTPLNHGGAPICSALVVDRRDSWHCAERTNRVPKPFLVPPLNVRAFVIDLRGVEPDRVTEHDGGPESLRRRGARLRLVRVTLVVKWAESVDFGGKVATNHDKTVPGDSVLPKCVGDVQRACVSVECTSCFGFGQTLLLDEVIVG